MRHLRNAGTVTGFVVKFRGYIKRTARLCRIRVATALGDAMAEIETDVVDISHDVTSVRDDVFTCKKCQNRYMNRSALEREC